MPGTAVIASKQTGNLLFDPKDVTVDLVAALANPKPATVLRRDAGSLLMTVNAPAQGYVWIDRTWWPGWEATVDGQSVPTYRLWGGQLVPVPAGSHTVEQRFVPWDVLAGLGLSLFGLVTGCVALWFIRRRLRRARAQSSAHVEPPVATT
jgi:uncharacterized membrane protein YfhO